VWAYYLIKFLQAVKLSLLQVKPGDVIAIEVTAGSLFMAEIPESDTISCMYQQTNAIHCTHEPLVAAHMYTASIFTVRFAFFLYNILASYLSVNRYCFPCYLRSLFRKLY